MGGASAGSRGTGAWRGSSGSITRCARSVLVANAGSRASRVDSKVGDGVKIRRPRAFRRAPATVESRGQRLRPRAPRRARARRSLVHVALGEAAVRCARASDGMTRGGPSVPGTSISTVTAASPPRPQRAGRLDSTSGQHRLDRAGHVDARPGAAPRSERPDGRTTAVTSACATTAHVAVSRRAEIASRSPGVVGVDRERRRAVGPRGRRPRTAPPPTPRLPRLAESSVAAAQGRGQHTALEHVPRDSRGRHSRRPSTRRLACPSDQNEIASPAPRARRACDGPCPQSGRRPGSGRASRDATSG